MKESGKKTLAGFLKIGGGFTAICGALFTLTHTYGLTVHPPEELPEVWSGLIHSALWCISGIFAFQKGRAISSLSTQEIIQMAILFGGKMTVTEFMLKSGYSLKTAKNKLDELHVQGIAEVRYTDSGVAVYVFKELLSPEEKSSAQAFN